MKSHNILPPTAAFLTRLTCDTKNGISAIKNGENQSGSLLLKVTSLVLCLSCFCVNAQQPRIELSKIEKDSTIRNIGKFFKENYVFPNKGEALNKELGFLNAQGIFDTVTDPLVFRRAVQNTIRKIIDDKHILFIYREPIEHGPFDPQTIKDTSSLKLEYEHRKGVNFGIPELRVLENNIGYMKITKFTSPELFGPVVKASSEYLKNVDGLILDLRSRGGGHSDAVVLLLSYFLPPETLVFRWKNREGTEFERNWTLPYAAGSHFKEKPVMILTSEKTFSGSEAFSYVMKHHERATLIGETTRGGAHSYMEMYPSEKFLILVPHQRVLSAKTNLNWEGTGVAPTILAPANKALEIAKTMMIEKITPDH